MDDHDNLFEIPVFRAFFNRLVFSDAIQLPRLGKLRLKEHNYSPVSRSHILSATVSERAGRWFASIQVEEDRPEPEIATGQPIGIDLGIKTLATLSDAKPFENPHALKHQLKKLKRLSRAHSRMQKGSKNTEKSRRKLAKLHVRIAPFERSKRLWSGKLWLLSNK